ncbi:hypothetical protein [Campylobacter subantarcticus]|nr:hypothetical protein [Campylobacter subantarcticus]
MFSARNSDVKTFHEAKKFGIIILTCYCLLWFSSGGCRVVWHVDE